MSFSDRDGFIWMDGKMVDWRDAQTHFLTSSLHYGNAVFEGIRAYETAKQAPVFFGWKIILNACLTRPKFCICRFLSLRKRSAQPTAR